MSNLDQGPFFELIVHAALQDNSRLGKWCMVLAEAALRSPVVAFRLCELPKNTAVEAFVHKIPRKRRWQGRELDSLYGQVITVAVNEPDVSGVGVALSILRPMRPCGNALYWSTRIVADAVFFGLRT